MGVLKRVASWIAICSLKLHFQQKFEILLFGATEFACLPFGIRVIPSSSSLSSSQPDFLNSTLKWAIFRTFSTRR